MLCCAFALSILLTNLILHFSYKRIIKKSDSLSEYYFSIDRHPIEFGCIFKAFDKFSSGFLISLFGIMFLLIIIALSAAISSCFADSFVLKSLEHTANLLQNGTNLLLQMAIAATFIFAAFRKPYYVLFDIQDVAKKYHLLFWVAIAIASWIFAMLTQFAFHIIFYSESSWDFVFFYVLTLFFLCISSLSCVVILFCSYRIFLLPGTTDLNLLLNLHYHIYDSPYQLKAMNCAPERAMSTNIEDYLINRLCSHSQSSYRKLKKHMPAYHHVEYWNAVDMAPLHGEKQIFYQICQIVKYIAPFFICISIEFLVLYKSTLISSQYAQFWIKYHMHISVLSIFTIALCTLFTAVSPSLSKMRRAICYGRWGYRILDKENGPHFYFSRNQFLHCSEVKWLHSIINLLTLYRIEALSVSPLQLLENLCDKFSEAKNESEIFSLKLVYLLCCCLGYLLDDEDIPASVANTLNSIMLECQQNQFLRSWARAIWADIKRDPTWYKEHGCPSIT